MIFKKQPPPKVDWKEEEARCNMSNNNKPLDMQSNSMFLNWVHYSAFWRWIPSLSNTIKREADAFRGAAINSALETWPTFGRG